MTAVIFICILFTLYNKSSFMTSSSQIPLCFVSLNDGCGILLIAIAFSFSASISTPLGISTCIET